MAKSTKGIVRKIDAVGRLVIPIEIYRQAGFIERKKLILCQQRMVFLLGNVSKAILNQIFVLS